MANKSQKNQALKSHLSADSVSSFCENGNKNDDGDSANTRLK